MRFQPVPIAATGPSTFACCKCPARIQQGSEPESQRGKHRLGIVWADLDGTPFVDYYCTPCKDQTLSEARDAEEQRNATTDYHGELGPMPAAEWCKGPHPNKTACSFCGPVIESHIMHKAVYGT